MAKIAVVTDSAACIPSALQHELNIRVIPFELVWDGVAYRNGESFTATKFYRRFRAAHSFPTTSQPPLGAFAGLYSRLIQEYDGIVSIHVSSEMTGTVRTARLAAEQVTDQLIAPSRLAVAPRVVSSLPVANHAPIVVLDSHTATMSEGFVVLAAARAAAQDASLEQVIAAAEQVIRRVDFFATLKTLEHVHRGGRLGEAAKLLGSQLKITPILNLKNGTVSIVGLTRAWNHAREKIVELTVERVQQSRAQGLNGGVHASVFHADALDDAEWLREQLFARLAFAEFNITEFSVVMGAHTGPDVIGVAFYVED